MKPQARGRLIRALFGLVMIGYALQAAMSFQAHCWADGLRSLAFVLMAVPLVGRPQLLLQPLPLSTSTIQTLPALLKCSLAAGGTLLAASFFIGMSH